MVTKQEFAGKIREKYNAYQDVDDNTLVDKFLEKYPVYKDRVDTEPSLIDTAVNTVKDIARPMKKAYKTYLDVVSPAEKLGVDVAKSAAQAAIDRSSFERFEKTLPEEPQPTPFSSKEEFRKANVVQKLSKMAQDPAMWLIVPPGMNMPTLPAKAAKQVVSADVALTSALAKAKAGQELSEAEAKAFKAWQEGQAKVASGLPKALPPRNENVAYQEWLAKQENRPVASPQPFTEEVMKRMKPISELPEGLTQKKLPPRNEAAAYEEALVGKPNRPVPELPSLTPEVKKNVSQLGELPKSVQAKSPTSLGLVPEGVGLPEKLKGTKVADETGRPIPVYSGHNNINLYGEYNPKKATAGGFYSTTDPEIASNYATGKFGIYENYPGGSEYRIKGKSGSYNKKLYQYELAPKQKQILNDLRKDEDNSIMFNVDYWVNGSRKYDKLANKMATEKQYQGEYSLQSLHDYAEQMGYTIRHVDVKEGKQTENIIPSDFDDLLDSLGVNWDSYQTAKPGVIKSYLKIKNPIDTSNPFPQDLLSELKKKAKYERPKEWQDKAHWTKDYSLKQWVDDIERDDGSHFWATQIPAKALPIIKKYGYDGIKDVGGKMGGDKHAVWIAFDKDQVIPAIKHGQQFGITPLSATERASVLKNLPGAVFGIEPTYDENGKQTGYRYNVGKGLMGVAGAGAIRAGGGKLLGAVPKGINLKNLKSLEPKLLDEMSAAIKPELEKVRGKTLSHAEVLDAAKDASILQKTFSREQTLAEEAAILRARQALAAASTSKGITKEYLDTLKSVNEYATARARQLGALGIKAEPIEAELAINKNKLIEKLLKIGKSTDEILKAGENVDWQDLQSVTKFYRSFVKPTLPEILDEYRYINLLSSPKTHIVNFTSNALQVAGLAPATKLFTGGIDAVGAAMTGRARQAYAAEAGAYYKGSVNSINEASKKALEVLRGAAKIARPDVAQIPTGAKLLKPFQIIPRALEASDVFFRTIAEGGEKNALAFRYAKQGKELTETAKALINEEAKNKAAYSIFRMPNDPQNLTGQGYILSAIDKFTQKIVKPLRRDLQIKDRTIWNPAKLLIPFVETPMNIFKQGFEYSPFGVANLPGAANKQEQLAKALIGSTVALGAYGLAVNGNTTWRAPANEKDRQIFYDSGRKPYSVKIGDKWVGYSRLGPIAYPIALATAINWYLTENPKAATEANEKRLMNVLSGIGGYFADQSYVEGLNNILQVLSGDVRGTAQLIGNAPAQYIPLSSLMRWANNIIDNVYRQSEKGFSLKSTIQNIAKGIPGASQTVPPILGPTGEPQKKPFPILNAISPLDISQYSPEKEQQLKGLYSARRLEAVGSQQREQLKSKAQELFNAMKGDSLEAQYKKLAKVYASNEALGDQLETLLEEQTMQFTGEDKLIKSLNANSGARAEYIKSKLKGLDKTQRNAFLVDLDNKGLLDDTTMELLSQ